jgi:uncharacterized DUF497 family protein
MQGTALDILRQVIGFEWDEANRDKIARKHHLRPADIEPVFFDPKAAVYSDLKHSANENRYLLLGRNHARRLLFVVFTIRDHHIRVISARPVTKEKEVTLYEKAA